MAWIQVIEPDDAQGKVAELYADIRKRNNGQIANIHKVRSLNPDVLSAQLALYRTLMFGRCELSRAQREMIAVVVSVVNRCPY